ncbi:MAG TPA: MMPL family transporter, partial [Phycisphaerales bacterium]|nr:MMPL family transporter [Phycisphaerales bacterium]
RPRLVLVCAAVAALLAILSLSRLHVSSSLAAMLGTRSEAAAAMQRVTTEYRSGDALLLLVEAPGGGEKAQAEALAFAQRLEASLKADPGVAPLIAWVRYREDPALLRFARDVMLPSGAFYLTDQGASELTRRLQPAAIREQIARNEALIGAPGPAGSALSAEVLRDPLRLFELVPETLRRGGPGGGGSALDDEGRPEFSADGGALLIRIGAVATGSDFGAAGRLYDGVLRRVSEVNTGGIRVEAGGFAAIAASSSRVIRTDAVVSSLASIGLLYFLFLLFYRRWTAALVIGGVAGAGMLVGIGTLALFLTSVSPLAAMIAALLAGLGTDYGIHFLSHYDGYRERGLSSVDASAETARHMAVPIVTNCFTSIFGFISLWPSKIQMLSDFAAMGTAGLIGALAAVFVLMPAALAAIDRRAAAGGAAQRARFGRLADVVARRWRTCATASLAALALVVAAAGLRGFDLRFESDLTVMHPRPSPALDTTAEVIKRFVGQGDLVPIELRAETPEKLLQAAHDLARALQSPACRAVGVTGVVGIHSLLPDPRSAPSRLQSLQALDAENVVTSFDAAVAESAFEPSAYAPYRSFLRTLVSARAPPTVDDLVRHSAVAERLFPAATLDGRTPPLRTVVAVHLSSPLTERVQRRAVVAALSNAAATVPGATVAGIAAVSEELEAAAREGLPVSVCISLVLVIGWLTIVFRRPLDVLLALVPLLFAGVTTVALIIALGQRFNPINSVAIPLLDGIAVDAGVFLVSVYRAHGSNRSELLGHLRSTTHAVLLSVGTTVTAFAALCFTHTPAVRSLGFVSAVGIVASGVGALLLLMPILIRRAPDRLPTR